MTPTELNNLFAKTYGYVKCSKVEKKAARKELLAYYKGMKDSVIFLVYYTHTGSLSLIDNLERERISRKDIPAFFKEKVKHYFDKNMRKRDVDRFVRLGKRVIGTKDIKGYYDGWFTFELIKDL